jgi:hypothetical protein
MQEIDVGDVALVTGVFTNLSGTLIDPDVVKFTFKINDSAETTYTYGVDSQVVKLNTGTYRAEINAATAGRYKCRFFSTGNGQGSGRLHFIVSPYTA